MYDERRFDIFVIQEAANSRITSGFQNVKLISASANYVEIEDEKGKIHIFTGNIAIFINEHDDSATSNDEE